MESLDPSMVLLIADILPCEHGELVADDWRDTADARFRSSVSRAYYSVFHSLRARLLSVGNFPMGFPEGGVHGKLKKALQDVLGRNDRLTRSFKSICEDRDRADYDPGATIDREMAESVCDAAEKATDWIDALTTDQLMRIANKLGSVPTARRV